MAHPSPMKGAMSDHRVSVPAPPRRLSTAALLGAVSALAGPGLAAGVEAPGTAETAPEPTATVAASANSPLAVHDAGTERRNPMISIAGTIAAKVTRRAPIVPARGRWSHQPTLEESLLAEINRVRTARRIPALLATPILRRPARGHARFLAVGRGGKLTHRDARGRPFHRRLVEAGWRARARMSENLAAINACRPQDPRLIVGRWLGSPPHRANLLDRKVTHAGIGVVSTAGCGMTVYTADFGN